MLRAALRNLFAHKLRLSLTVLTIALGIAFITGTNIFTDSLKRSFDELFLQPQPDLVVTPKSELDGSGAGGGGGFGAQPLTFPDSVLTDVRGVDGVAAAYGVVSGSNVFVLGPDDVPVGPAGPPARAQSWVPDQALTSLRVTSGRAPESGDEVALLDSTAQQASVSVGDRIRIDTPEAGVLEPTVVGLVSRGISGSLGGTLTVFDLATAQQALLGAPELTQVVVSAAPGVSQDQLREAVAAQLGPDVTIRTGQESTDDIAQRIEEGFAFFNTFLLVFGLIALFVSTFLIFNTFSMLVAQRTRELAMLRAVGATRGQVSGSVVVEAALVGVVAAALGLAGGIGVSLLLRTLFATFGASLPPGPLVVEPSTIVLAVGVGLVVTVLAALLPARRAAVIPPVAAMREDTALPQRSLRRLTVVGAVLVLLAVPTAIRGLALAADDTERAATWVGLSALLALVGVIALTPWLSRPLLRALGLPWRRWAVGRLAVENGRRNPRRTAATASALAIGLALMTTIGVIAASAKASVTEVVDDTIGADFVVFGRTFQPFTHDVYKAIADTPGTAVVTYARQVPIEVDGQRAPLTGVDPQALPQVLDITMVEGSLSDLGLGNVVVDTTTARELGLTVGEDVEATFVNGPGTLKLVGTYEPAGFFQGYVVNLNTITSIGSLERDSAVYIRLAPGADADAVRADLTERLKPYPSVRVQDQADIKREINSQFDVLFGFVYALLALSVIVAFLGIVNTLSLSVFERTREIGLLRAVGTARSQVRRMVVLEAMLMAVFGALVGVATGLVYGSLLQRVLEPQGISQLSVPGGQLVAFVLLGALGGIVAAVWPAWRASRLDVLRAIATE
ncbi:MAG: FtsX-like permease family protein [Candidatus Nanopelagicales bacterium]